MVLLGKKLRRAITRRVVETAKNADPQELMRASEEAAVRSFQRCCEQSHFYQELCRKQQVPIQRVKTIQDFRNHVPVVDKKGLFDPQGPLPLSNDIDIHKAASILLSSGSGGAFSFGLALPKDHRSIARMLETLLDDYYGIAQSKALLINCLAQAVKLPDVDICVAEIGPRADSLAYLLRTLSARFAQTIIIADNIFIKNALEDAAREGVDLERTRIHLIVGGSYLPESLRTYLASLLRIDFNDRDTGTIYSSMGISEFGLNLFFESEETCRLRRLVYAQTKTTDSNVGALREAPLLGEQPFLPMLFNYLPQNIYVEEQNGALLITDLNDNPLLPLIRYHAQDKGTLIGFDDLKDRLGEYDKPEFLPRFRSPLALVLGKAEALECQGKAIYPQLIQEALYREETIARAVTGNFRLEMQQGGKPHVKIQCRASQSAPTEQIQKSLPPLINTDISVQCLPYHEFPYSMELDYERKIKFI